MKKLFVLITWIAMLLCISGCTSHDCVAGDWTITKDASYLESGERTRFCTECDEAVEIENFELDSYIDNRTFVFSPAEFSSKLNELLADADGEYNVSAEVRDEDNVVVSYIYRDSKASSVCQIVFLADDEEFTGDSQKNKVGATFLMMFFDKSCDENDLCNVLPAFLKSINPLISSDDAQTLADKIIVESEDGGIREDDVLYRLIDISSVMDEKWLFITSLED